jgi:hypothetical protein
MKKKLVTGENVKVYMNRNEKMVNLLNSDEGERLFFSKITAISEQVDNIHVKAIIGNLMFENDGPKGLGGSG